MRVIIDELAFGLRKLEAQNGSRDRFFSKKAGKNKFLHPTCLTVKVTNFAFMHLYLNSLVLLFNA